MDTNNLFKDEGKNKDLENVNNDGVQNINDKTPNSKTSLSLMNIIIPLFLVSLIIVLAVLFPFLWFAGGMSGTAIGIAIPFIDLIVLVIVIFIYSRWKKRISDTPDPNQKKRLVIILTTIAATFALGVVGFLIYQYTEAEKSQKEYNEIFYSKKTDKRDVAEKKQSSDDVKKNMEYQIPAIEKCVKGGGFVSEPVAESYICDKKSVTNVRWRGFGDDVEWGGCDFVIEKNNNIINTLQYCVTLSSGEVIKCTRAGCFDVQKEVKEIEQKTEKKEKIVVKKIGEIEECVTENKVFYEIPEFGIKFLVEKSAKDDLIYFYKKGEYGGEFVYFSSKSLAAMSDQCDVKTGPLGAISKYQGLPENHDRYKHSVDQMIKFDGYFITGLSRGESCESDYNKVRDFIVSYDKNRIFFENKECIKHISEN